MWILKYWYEFVSVFYFASRRIPMIYYVIQECIKKTQSPNGEGLDPIYQMNPVTFCACPKPGPEFSMSSVVIFSYAQWLEVSGDFVRFVDIVGYKR